MNDTNKSSLFVGVYILLIVLMANFSMASLGTFKQNEAVDIRVLANCSSIDLIEVNDGTTTYIINTAMDSLGGQTFNYSFINTSSIGTYSYSWNNPCVDCATNECGNSFVVSKYGNNTVLWLCIILFVFVISLVSIFAFVKKGSKLDKNKSRDECSEGFEKGTPIKGIILSVIHSFLEHYVLWGIVLGIIPVWCFYEIVSISGMVDLVNIVFWIFSIYFILVLFSTLYWFDLVFKFVKNMMEQVEELKRGTNF